MPTSGTITFNETAQQLITDALQLLNVVAAGEVVGTNDYNFGLSALNRMLKAWMAMGIHLWTEEEGTVFFVNGQAQYNLQAGASGAQGSDGSGTPVETSVTANTSSGGTTITCATVVGMTANDNIGVQQSNNTLFWTTINTINTSTKVVTLNASTTASVSSGAQVYTYTTQIPRVLSVQTGRVRDSNNFDRRIKMITRQEYMMIPQKQLTGTPTVAYYSAQINNTQLFLWPTPNDVSQRLHVTYLREIQDMTSQSDTPDLPQEWLEAIVYNLAVRLAPAYGVNLSSGGISGNPDILRQASQYLDEMKGWDAEQWYINIIPNWNDR